MSNEPGNNDITGAATLNIISGAKRFNRWMYEEIKPHLKGCILELGSGTGNISELVLNDKFETVLSDYNLLYASNLKKKFAGYTALQEVIFIDLKDPFFVKNNAHAT